MKISEIKKKYTRLKPIKFSMGVLYKVVFTVGNQSFSLEDVWGKDEAEWIQGQLAKALQKLITKTKED